MQARIVAAAFALLALAGCVSPSMQESHAADFGLPPGPTLCPPAPAAPESGSAAGRTSESNTPGAYWFGGQGALLTQTHTARWSNPSPTARASWSDQSATGSYKVAVFDACGKKLYDHESGLGQDDGYRSLPLGEPGVWIVRFEMTSYTGQLSFSLTS